jgi:acyl-CoA reductase-like NAD-dependent aldehyde dehydrogenase
LIKYGNFINGKYDFEGEEYDIISPIEGSKFSTGIKADAKKTREAIDIAYENRERWDKTSLSKRKKIFQRLVEIFETKTEEYAYMESMNTGKTLRQSTFMDANIALEHIKYFANTNEFKPKRNIKHPEYTQSHGIVENRPMGVIGAISPWNVPLLMAVWKIIPALLTGNTVVIKPSHFTPCTTFELALDLKKAGLPDGVLNIVNGDGSVVGKELAKNPKIRAISFTGSTETGKIVTKNASGTIKKVVMELGGKSPSIVLNDADLDKTAKGVLFGIFLHSGQLCESGSRLIVQDGIKDKLLNRISYYMEKMNAGNPMDMETDMGAITTREQKIKIEKMTEKAIDDGGKVLFKREISSVVPKGGYYVSPMVMGNIDQDMEIYKEEIFGPVLTVTEFHKIEEAIQLSNTKYGLAASIWSDDYKKAIKLSSEINAGTVWINDHHLISAAAPRGGFGDSGIGRELGREGLYEFTETRHIFVSHKDNDLSEISYGLIVS